MMDVDTLYVISSWRGDYVLDDMLAAIAWSSTRSFFVIVVDLSKQVQQLTAPGKYQIVHSDLPPETCEGFHRAAGLKWAIDTGIAYKQVIMLHDTCLPVTQTLDSFFIEQMQPDGLGVLGVHASLNGERAWQDARTQLFQWKVPTEAWERPPISLCDDFLVLAPRLASLLYLRNLLVPPGCSNWPGTYGSYISWVCQMLNMYVVGWGYETKPLPPVYVSHTQGQYLPAPHLFGQRLLVFSPINKIMGYAEGDIRELYKQQRGERAREIAKLKPVVHGPDQSDIAFTAT